MKVILSFILVIVLFGCATKPITSSEAQQLSALGVNEFFQKRFIENPSFLDKVANGVDAYSRVMNRGKESVQGEERTRDRETIGLMNDGKTIIFKTVYNIMDTTQLERPKIEAFEYCNVTGGKLANVKIYSGNFPEKFYENPNQVISAMSRAICNENCSMEQQTIVDRASEIYFANLDETNRLYNKHEAVNAYQSASDKNSFGIFECNYSNNSRYPWEVMILPFSFTPSVGSGSSAHHLKILISPTLRK